MSRSSIECRRFINSAASNVSSTGSLSRRAVMKGMAWGGAAAVLGHGYLSPGLPRRHASRCPCLAAPRAT